MTILFAGGENSEVDILSGSTTTDTARFRSTYARCAVRSANENGVLHTYSGELAAYIAAQGTACDFWYGFQYFGAGGATTGSSCVTFCGAGFVPFFRVGNFTGAVGTCYAQTSTDGFTLPINGTSYLASTIAQPISVPAEWVFRIKRHASSGLFQWWIDRTLWFEITGDTTAFFTTVTRTSWGNAGSNPTCAISEIIATSADDPRVGMNCFTAYYTGNGANTDWTGTYTDVAENSEDTSTVMTTGSAAKDSCFTHASLPALSAGVIVRAVVPSGKWRTASGAPQNLYPYLRIAGTNYANAPLPSAMQAVALVAGLLQGIWHLNPATGLAFTEAEVNALQPGMRSAA